MLGTHNSMTFLSAENWLWELLSAYWRCQEKTISEQLKAGVKWFDIRVAYTPGRLWKFAHGAIDLRTPVVLDEVLRAVQEAGGVVRIMLEKGDEQDEQFFAEYFAPSHIGERWPCIIGAVIKKKWRVLWNKDPACALQDCSYVPYKRNTAWYRQLKTIIGFPWKSIKKRAARVQKIDRQQLENQQIVWVYDYV